MKVEIKTEADVDGIAQQWGNVSDPNGSGGRVAAILPPLVSAAELYEGQIVITPALYEDLLYNGLTMLIARQKAGKSWYTLQLAVDVAGGRQVDGITALDHGTVLYAALEEPKTRTMRRLRKIAPDGAWTKNLHFVYELLPLMGGGAEQLGALIQKLRPRLVVLDTLTALVKAGGKSGNDVFRSQYAEVSRLRKLAEEFRTAIIVVHHTRKGLSDGAVEAVAGTGGIAAAVDALWLLKRKPEGEATLDIIGRDTEESSLAMRFDQEPFGWRVLGNDDAQLMNSDRRQVLELLREDGPMTPAQIAAELGRSRPSVRMLLKRMKEDLLVRKEGTKYVPSLSVSYSVTDSE